MLSETWENAWCTQYIPLAPGGLMAPVLITMSLKYGRMIHSHKTDRLCRPVKGWPEPDPTCESNTLFTAGVMHYYKFLYTSESVQALCLSHIIRMVNDHNVHALAGSQP